MKLFFIGIVLGLITGAAAWDFYQRLPVSVPLIEPMARLTALDAIDRSTSIVIETAENYDINGKPTNTLRTIPVGSATKNELIKIFSKDEQTKMPRFMSRLRSVTACFIPHHKIKCIDSNKKETDIYICFDCSNFSVGRGTSYYYMSADFRESLRELFIKEGFQVPPRKSEQDAAANP